MTMILEGKSIVITGAFGALGAAVVEAALAAGARVAAVDRAEAARAPKFSSGVRVWGGINFGAPDLAAAVFNSIADTLGGLDGLVNVAGAFRWETVADGSIETWDLLYSANLKTALGSIKCALPHLLKKPDALGGGRIINIGAAAAAIAGAGMGAYAASKSAVVSLTQSLAAEMKDRGITVNAVQPSIIDTPANRAQMPAADFSRWVKPQQIADVIVFLLSAKAAAITGAAIPVMGRV